MKKTFTQSLSKALLCLHALLLTLIFTHAQPSNPNDGPGGPVLVISNTSNPFSRYMVEILRAEGLNAFSAADISTVTESGLNNYDVAILGEIPLNAGQVTMFSNWVNNGGTLITMRPDAQLQSLLGITPAVGTLSEAYLLVNTSEGPGVGIVNQTIQYHGTADLYTLNGATALATLYADAATATANPAVTTHNVGANGGRAVAFTYDLAKSVNYTRQGNPPWAGDERDGQDGPIRSNDMFYGAKDGDNQPDWIDFNKIAIPQADEQQRLLTNIIIQSNFHRKPLPRFWFLPRGLKVAIVMTGDDHGTGGTAGRFKRHLDLSPEGASVANWTAIRSTSYIFPNTPITNEQVASYQAQGFEIGLHVNTDCNNWTPASLTGFITDQKAALLGNLSNINPIVTNRTHCIAWSDWASEAEVEAAHGIRLDVNYYYWPESWVQNRPGMFTGSGMPMRFAKTDGSLIDCYQVPTQMTDESGINYSSFCNALLDKALGQEGYYGVFCANMHTDLSNGAEHEGSEAIIASALARQVPVISAKQMLTWLDGRNNSSFGITSWDNNQLSFSITAAEGANFLQAMLPKYVNNLKLSSITRNGVQVPFTSQMIKGMEYGFYEAATGDYIANYTECVAPTATITATSPVCQGEPVKLTLASATGVAPFDLIVNGVTYTGVQVGDEFASFSASEKSIWSNTDVPELTNANDGQPIEVGVKFRSSVNGYVAGVRFYKGSGDNGTHIGKLWSADGSTLLASAAFTNETESGWQEVRFDAPVYITANTTYVASYYSPAGYFAFTGGGLSNAVSNSSLTALSAGTDGPNGVFKYGGGFPNDPLSGNANYWADVLFTEVTSSGSPIEYVLTSITDAGECNNTGAALSTATVTINALPSGSLSPVTPVCAGEEVFLTFNGATGTAPYTLVINGETFNNVNDQAAFNTHIQAPLGEVHTIWDASTTGGTQTVDDRAVELGVRFTSDIAGYITGIRFYKMDIAVRTYTGHLWDPANPAAPPLATATLTTDNTVGWKQINFASPVAINANTTYMASYFSPDGYYYAYTAGGLNSNVVNSPLTALAGSRFRYQGDNGFPFPSDNSDANYWVDVAFQTQATETISLTRITDANGCQLEGDLQTLVLNAEDCSALPVTLTGLSASSVENNVKLTWQTASENNNKGFEVQRSTDGVQWTNIGFVNGSGNSSGLHSYAYNDNNLAPDRYYYRLRQVDMDGHFSYSSIVSVNLNGLSAGYALQQNYPNPFNRNTIIQYSVPQSGWVKLTLFDINGRQVKVLVQRMQEKGTHSIELNGSGLSRGTYYYKMETSHFSATKKMVIL